MKAAWHWKEFNCPTCTVGAGESCGRRPLGVPWGWVRTAPHAARKRLAEAENKRVTVPDPTETR